MEEDTKLMRATKGHSPLLGMDIQLQSQSGIDFGPRKSKDGFRAGLGCPLWELTALAHLVH